MKAVALLTLAAFVLTSLLQSGASPAMRSFVSTSISSITQFSQSLVPSGPTIGSSAELSRAPATSTAQYEANADAQKQSIKPIIRWLKKAAPKYWGMLKAAVKKGYGAFKNWYNDLPGWIRWTIDILWSGTLWELFVKLKDYLF